jgi:hypothetical protein
LIYLHPPCVGLSRRDRTFLHNEMNEKPRHFAIKQHPSEQVTVDDDERSVQAFAVSRCGRNMNQ